MTLDELLAVITPEVYETLQQAVALGRWPEGDRLNDDQRAQCLQAVLMWGERNLPPEQRVGYVPPLLATSCGTDRADGADTAQPLRWLASGLGSAAEQSSASE